ncbi:MAG TPA: YncE family protein [Acidobacteriaceae bacterium]|nr:YncE family protein [Acidobacteriaceae bacterium]
MMPARQTALSVTATMLLLAACGCRRTDFPQYAATYREYAYVTNGDSNTVTVLDLVNRRQDRVLAVGQQPTGVAVNPLRNEVYAVNTQPSWGTGSVSVIDAENNRVVATIAVRRLPYFIDVDSAGKRGYVANAGSNNISVIDLPTRREIEVIGAGEQPGLARIAPDMRSLVVTNRGSGSVSIFSVDNNVDVKPLKLRAVFRGCAGATDAVILPDSSKAFIACTGENKVMAISLAAAPDSWAARQDSSALTDHLLTLLDVGKTPVQLALKPDGGELFVANFDSDSISEVSTQTNDVSGTYTIGAHPVFGVVSADNGTLWESNFGADTVSAYAIDDGKLVNVIHVGAGPDALALSAEGHLLLAADAKSGDVSVVRTQEQLGPSLFDMWPSGSEPHAIAIKAFDVP